MKEAALELAFSGGIDQSTRSEILDPRASFVMLENVRARAKGAVEKRYGFAVHASTDRADSTGRGVGYRMFADGKKTCITDGALLDVFSPDNDDQISRGRVPDCGLSLMGVPSPPGQTSIAVTDSIRVGDYLVLTGASAAHATVYCCVLEAETGQVILPYTAVVVGSAGEIYGLLGARGNTAMLFVAEGSNSDIMVSSLNCTDAVSILAGWSAPSNDITDANGLLAMNVASSGTLCWVAYVNDSGGASQVSVVLYDGGAGGSATINTGGATPAAIGLHGTSGTLWVAWNESTNIRLKGLSGSNLAVTNASTATVITANTAPSAIGNIQVVTAVSAISGRLFVNDGTGGRLHMRSFTTSVGAVTTPSAQATAYGVQMAGAPFRYGSRYYAVCLAPDDEGDNGERVLCDLSEADAWVRPVANLPPRVSHSIACARCAAHSTTEFWFPYVTQTTGRTYSGSVAKFDFLADARWRATAHNGVTFLSGGLVTFFDGLRVAESGFVVRPPAVTMSTNTAGSFSATGDGIRVVITYEHADAAGNVHTSAVSAPVASGSFSNETNLAIVVRNLGISSRIAAATDPNTRICIWATPDGGESPYYLVTTLTNTLTGETQTYNMTAHVNESGPMLMGTGELPGTGAQQDRMAPVGLNHLCSYNGFLVGALGETVYWTGQDIGGEGAWWNPLFQQPCSGGGDITALDCQDGTVFVWKRDRIFAMAGQPPTDNGADGGLGAPVRLAVDIGARLPFTCVTSLGIFFVSDRGIELLNRARSVEFIGEGVQDTFDAFPHVTAMTYDADSSCVLIECVSGFSNLKLANGTGRTLVYDTRSKVWRSIDRRSVEGVADRPAQDGCVVWNGDDYRYAWLGADGTVYVEDQESKMDSGGDDWIRMYAKTSWIHLSGIQGEQNIDRALLLGEHEGDHDLTIGVANDYDDTFVSETLDSDQVDALPIYNIDRDISQQTGQAVMLEIEDATPTGDDANDASTGVSAKWVALTFNGTAKSGVKRTGAVLRGGTDG